MPSTAGTVSNSATLRHSLFVPYRNFEYAAACHMIMVGLVDEGMSCDEAVRHRYDGAHRNPWNEFECGNNYARSKASYALLNAFSGFQFDMVNGSPGFHPIQPQNGGFRCFWSLDGAWGQFQMTLSQCSLEVLHGALPLQRLHLPFLADNPVAGLTLDKLNGTISLETRTDI